MWQPSMGTCCTVDQEFVKCRILSFAFGHLKVLTCFRQKDSSTFHCRQSSIEIAELLPLIPVKTPVCKLF